MYLKCLLSDILRWLIYVTISDNFGQFWAVNKKLMEMGGDDMFRHIPFRIYQVRVYCLLFNSYMSKVTTGNQMQFWDFSICYISKNKKLIFVVFQHIKQDLMYTVAYKMSFLGVQSLPPEVRGSSYKCDLKPSLTIWMKLIEFGRDEVCCAVHSCMEIRNTILKINT